MLPPRPVTVSRFDVLAIRREGVLVDVDVTWSARPAPTSAPSPVTWGPGSGVGGHLTALRRTRVGAYLLDAAHTLDALADDLIVLPIAEAAREAFPARAVDAAEAVVVSHGGPLPASGADGPVAVFGPDGTFLALLEDRGETTKALAVFV